jgi:phage repressor protein C with HTH and peptisase S24 domain
MEASMKFDHSLFAERVAELAGRMGRSYLELAELADVSVASLRNYRTGRGAPKRSTLVRMAESWGVMDSFLTERVYAEGLPTSPDPGRLRRNLLEACEYRRLDPKALAVRAGAKAEDVAALLMGALPSRTLPGKLASALRVREDWLRGGREPVAEAALSHTGDAAAISRPTFNVIAPPMGAPADDPEHLTRNIVAVPILSGHVAAGGPGEVIEHEVEDFAFCYKPHLENPDSTTCVRVFGDSMGDVVPDGALVGIDHAVTDIEAIGRRQTPLAAVRDPLSDGILIRRVKVVGKHVIFRPEIDLPGHTTVVWNTDDESAANPVVGAVAFIYRACT